MQPWIMQQGCRLAGGMCRVARHSLRSGLATPSAEVGRSTSTRAAAEGWRGGGSGGGGRRESRASRERADEPASVWGTDWDVKGGSDSSSSSSGSGWLSTSGSPDVEGGPPELGGSSRPGGEGQERNSGEWRERGGGERRERGGGAEGRGRGGGEWQERGSGGRGRGSREGGASWGGGSSSGRGGSGYEKRGGYEQRGSSGGGYERRGGYEQRGSSGGTGGGGGSGYERRGGYEQRGAASGGYEKRVDGAGSEQRGGGGGYERRGGFEPRASGGGYEQRGSSGGGYKRRGGYEPRGGRGGGRGGGGWQSEDRTRGAGRGRSSWDEGDGEAAEGSRGDGEGADGDAYSGGGGGGGLRQFWIGDVLYGVSPVLAALQAGRREVHTLYLQDGMDLAKRKDKGAIQAVKRRAEELGARVAYASKHDLNMMADNRPHQGVMLDCSALEFENLTAFPDAPAAFGSGSSADGAAPGRLPVWLCLDEVMDPQNFGAALRCAHFLGVDGVLTCHRNSAPLSAVVSKASSGAMELMPVHSTKSLPGVLADARTRGWQVLGAASEQSAVSAAGFVLRQPAILVMGNEGYGLRTTVRRLCDAMLQIDVGSPVGRTGASLVDSLNVSVATGILLHRLLTAQQAPSAPKVAVLAEAVAAAPAPAAVAAAVE